MIYLKYYYLDYILLFFVKYSLNICNNEMAQNIWRIQLKKINILNNFNKDYFLSNII
jgi:hypothetical protein